MPFPFDLPNGETFFDLSPGIGRTGRVTGVPDVGIQWRVPVGEPAESVGRGVRLGTPR